MTFLRRLWGYVKTLFRMGAERAMDPEVEIEQAIQEARRRDQELRSQAARVIAHRTQLEAKIEKTADTAGEARELAKQALVRADEARQAGDQQGVEKWSRAAQGLALKLQAAEAGLEGLKDQYEVAIDQAEDAKRSVSQNAMRLQELAAKRMELLGRLEHARMQEAVNEAVEAVSASLEAETPTLDRIERKIAERLASAQARTELREATPEGAEAELREAVTLTEADARLKELRAELGLAET